MTAYVILVEHANFIGSTYNCLGISNVSSEGYRTLKEAQSFCERRSENPQKIDEYTYKVHGGGHDTTYTIKEVSINE